MTTKNDSNPYGLYQRNNKGNWYLPVRIDGQRKFVTTGTDDRGEAEKRAPQIIARISAGIPSRPEGITVKQAFEQQIHERKLLDAPRNTLINWQQSQRVWCEQLGEDTLIADIMPRNINEFLSRKELKKGTKRHHCIMLQTALKRAARMSNIEMRQDLFPRELMSRAAITIRRRFLSEEELSLVLRECQPEHRDYIIAFVYSGMRKQELFALRVDHIDLERDVIHVPATKSAYALAAIPLASSLRPIVERRIKESGTKDYLFPPKNDLSKNFRVLSERIGIEHFTVHDLRRTCGSLLINRNVDIASVSAILRHKDISTTIAVYAHLSPKSKKEAIDALPPINSSGRIRQMTEGRRRIDNVRVRQIDVETGEVIAVYNSIADAIRATGIHGVAKCVGGFQKSAGGYAWERVV
jgi:integrase